ncbi:hypothetical protein BHM03_00015992 [Ensete ventricosum]|nr:hypothetical protein BHM03_00015992 [Ensete ventricosum]
MSIVEHGRRQRRQWRQREERPTVAMTKDGVALWLAEENNDEGDSTSVVVSLGKGRRGGVLDVSLFIHSIMAATTMLLPPPATHAVSPSSATAIASIALPTIALPSAIAAKPLTPLLPLPSVTISGLQPQLKCSEERGKPAMAKPSAAMAPCTGVSQLRPAHRGRSHPCAWPLVARCP